MEAVIIKARKIANGNWKLTVRCPYCKKTHTHGDSERYSNTPRHRGSHCCHEGYSVVESLGLGPRGF